MNRKDILIVAVTIAASFTFIGCGGDSGSSSDFPTIKEAPYDQAPPIDETTKQEYIDLINEIRDEGRDCGHYKQTNDGQYVLDENNQKITIRDGSDEDWRDPVDPIDWNESLYKAAAEHNADLMHMGKDISHNGSGGPSDYTAQVSKLDRGSRLEERLLTNGYKYAKAYENITAGTSTSTPQQAIDKWLNSAGHCKNLMSAEVKEFGMIYEHNDTAYYKNYWTIELGKPAKKPEGVI
jgi:uncharacterized protein YkwD